MAKKLKDVNKDGKINFKDTWLGERLSTKGKLKGPNLAESLKGARRESGDTTSTKSPKPKPRPATKTGTKPQGIVDEKLRTRQPSGAGRNVPVKTVAELRAEKLKNAPKGTVDEKLRTRQPFVKGSAVTTTNATKVSDTSTNAQRKVKALEEAEARRKKSQNTNRRGPATKTKKVVAVPYEGTSIFDIFDNLSARGVAVPNKRKKN